MPNCKSPSVAPATGAELAADPANDLVPPATETILSLENVARMFSVSRLTLRYYEFRGLIKRRHRIGHVPVYGWADCDRIAFIIKCRRVGLSLGEVAPIIAAVDHEPANQPANRRNVGNCSIIFELVRLRINSAR